MKTLARRTIGVLATLVVTNAVGCFCPIGACAENPVVEPRSAAFSQDAAAAAGSTVTSSGCAQAVVFRFQQGPILGICNAAPIRVKHGSYRIPRGREPFSIAVRDAKGQIATLLEEGGVGANAFSITVRPGTGLTVTEELDADAHGTKPTIYYAFIRQGISCDKDTCRLDKKTCVLDLPKALYPDIVRQVEAHPEADESAYKLLLRALSGDAKAARLLNRFPETSSAHGSAMLATYQETYREAKDLGCHALTGR